MSEQRKETLQQILAQPEKAPLLRTMLAKVRQMKEGRLSEEIRQNISELNLSEQEKTSLLEDLETLLQWKQDPAGRCPSVLSTVINQSETALVWKSAEDDRQFQIDILLERYKQYMLSERKSENTISAYLRTLNSYIRWYAGTYGDNVPCVLMRVNALEYIAYLRNIRHLQEKSVNTQIAALTHFDCFLTESGLAKEFALSHEDYFRVQQSIASLCLVSQADVEEFRQKVLLGQGVRDYAIVTVMAYAGLRISEVLKLGLYDIDFTAGEIGVHGGKGDKARIVWVNDKIERAVKEYLKVRPETECPYLFVSRQGGMLNRTRLNQICKKYSDIITPHQLRHFFCSHALEVGYTVAEVANQAGHSNPYTTMQYTNPSRKQMQEKANRL